MFHMTDIIGLLNLRDVNFYHELNANRPLAAVPFAGKFRLIDFTLSSLVNADVGDIGILLPISSNSIMDHIRGGKEWNLAKIKDGLFYLPPDPDDVHIKEGCSINSYFKNMRFVDRGLKKYIILSFCDSAYNADFNNKAAQKKQPWEIATGIASKALAKTSKSSSEETPPPPGNKLEQNAHLLRYAPAVGNAVMSLTDILGLTNKPDNSIAQMLNNTPEVPFNPIGNYLTYNPLDINYHRNNLLAQTSATRRALMSDVSPSKGANIVAADYNANMAMGNLARQAEEYNLAQRAKVEEFNRGTNMFNSEGIMKAAQTNAEMKLRTKLAQAQLMSANEERSASAKSANLSNLFESLSGIGREQTFLNSIKSDNTLYYERLPDGTIRYKNTYYSLSSEEKKMVDAQIKTGK